MGNSATVTLNDVEKSIVKWLAKKRIERNREAGAKATIYGKRDPAEAEVEHYGAEIAFCKLFNLYPDLNFIDHKDCDCITHKGNKVDVKHTVRENGRLLVKVKEREILPDYYAMMVGKFPEYRFVGFILSSELLREERIDLSLPSPAYAATQLELFPDEK